MIHCDYRLYLVTDRPAAYRHGLLAGVEAALAGGVTLVQYRATTGTRREHYDTALALRVMLRARGLPLIINDAVDLALAVDAEGVHVGQADLPVGVARRLIGTGRMLGLSISALRQFESFDPALVDYVGAGPVYPTGSKADAAPPLGLDELRRLVARSPRPVVAIGGITADRAPEVFATGAAGVAVVAALSQAQDPAAAARALLAAASRE